MATLINKGTGNFTAAGTWGVVDATSLSDSEAANTSLTTSYQESSTFTPGAITVEGIAIKIASRAAGSPSNTITVHLAIAGVEVTGTATTMNVSDIDACSTAANEGGWYFFTFNSGGTPASVLLLGATLYSVGIKLSATSTAVNVYSASGTNWTRMLRTATTGAPAANDIIHTMGDNLAAGTKNSYTVTHDNTATTSFGTTTPPAAFSVSKGGTFTWGTNALNYYLKISGTLVIYSSGTWNMGTSGTPIPSTATAVLEFNSAVNVDSGFIARNASTVNIYGASIATVATLMTADKAAAATVITLASTSGWSASDNLAFASTTRTAGDCEKKTISTVDSGTQVTLTAGLTNAHSGTSPTQAEVINLTRNVKIRGISGTLQGYVDVKATAVVNIQYVEFTQLGSNVTSPNNARGIIAETTTGTFIMKFCAVHDSTVSGSTALNITGTSGQTAATVIYSNNVIYNVDGNFSAGILIVNATSGTWTMDSNVFIKPSGGGVTCFSLSDVGGTFTNNTAVGGATGISAIEAGAQFVTFSGNTSHSNSSSGFSFGGIRMSNLTTITVWRNGSTGVIFSAVSTANQSNVIDQLIAFGNTTANINLSLTLDTLFTNCILSGDSTFATATGVIVLNSGNTLFESCTFGVATGIKVAHSSQDFSLTGFGTAILRNCLLASTTEVASFAAGNFRNAFVLSQKHDQTAGNHKFWLQYGVGSIDTVIFNTASPSLRLTPNTAGSKLESAPPGYGWTAAVANGGTITASAAVRKSISTDAGGANYNGVQQRLIVRKNVAAGIAADTVLATAAAATGTWETLSGTTAAVTDDAILEFIVDCDGTAGWVNVDDFAATPIANTKGLKYWQDGVPCVSGDNTTVPLSRIF